MSAVRRILVASLAVLGAALALSLAAQPQPGVFATVDLFVVSETPVAAWQVELTERSGSMQVVGIERGDDATFRDPPFYDRVVLERDVTDRVVLASFSLSGAETLPRGRVRVARVHVRTTGGAQPDYEARLVAAGAADGQPIAAGLNVEIEAGR
jgi:hypothetical protein